MVNYSARILTIYSGAAAAILCGVISIAKPCVDAAASWFRDALGEAGAFSRRFLKNFFRLFAFAVAAAVLFACAACLAASNGQIWRGAMAAGLTFLAGGILAVLVAGKLSLVLALSETVKANAVGQRILDILFSRLLGVTTENPEGDRVLTRGLHGVPVSQLEARLSDAGCSLLSTRVAEVALPKPLRWIAGKAQRLLVWATIRVVVAYATADRTRGEVVDLLALRSSLATKVDDLLARRISRGVYRFALLVALGFSVACWALFELLRRIPIGQP